MLDRKRLHKEIHEGCVGELIDMLISRFNEFVQHVRVKRIQAAAFQEVLQKDDCVVIQVDFATKYSCECQEEIQPALWSHQSVTLFTAA